MKFITVPFVEALLLGSTALALPSLAAERDAATVSQHQGSPVQRVAAPGGRHGTYSSNWAGAVLDSAPGTYSTVSGTFTVPTLGAPPLAAFGPSGASVWLGLDGYSCPTALLQAGIDLLLDGPLPQTFTAWYQWYPLPATPVVTVPIKAGDAVRLSVVADTQSRGSVLVENLTTGARTHVPVGGPALCRASVEWGVGVAPDGGAPLPLADFHTVVFTNATARMVESAALEGRAVEAATSGAAGSATVSATGTAQGSSAVPTRTASGTSTGTATASAASSSATGDASTVSPGESPDAVNVNIDFNGSVLTTVQANGTSVTVQYVAKGPSGFGM